MASSLLILGGARSGKSRFALAGLPARGRVTVLATAEPRDGDMAARIARHQAERSPHWTTVEAPRDLVPRLAAALDAADTVVVDCLTLWVSNLMLAGESDEAILKQAQALAALVAAPAADLRAIANEVGLGVHPPTADGLRFRDVLGLVNQRVAASAHRVVLMVAGLPHLLKDTPPASPFGGPAHEAP
ncbi:MAG TPA: bifunctional adenosylcobinamide kinase/adenosylcobinamide-phosphate guanylyltransferase [Methylomirabilota bacterium]|nr:bifunctional adenosylcobinamide kinase/adenosylcobinamide-phosphate guanylyltransferase [Methylomirabilota bacterium]